MEKKFPHIYSNFIEQLNFIGCIPEMLPNTNDIWARDFMPIQVSEDKFIEYRYDPDYLQGIGKKLRPTKTYPDIVCSKINLKTIKSDIILDGGNVVKSTNCVILTDKIFKENKHHYNEDKLLLELKRMFEVDRVIIIPWDKDEFLGHTDGMIRFIDNVTVLVQGFFELFDNKFKQDIYGVLLDNGLKVKSLNVDADNEYSWAYLNFLQTKDLILLPSLGYKKEDNEALKQINDLFPAYAKLNRIRQINMLDIIKEGGALNCITWTIKA